MKTKPKKSAIERQNLRNGLLFCSPSIIGLLAPWFPELLELCRIDCLASHGDLSGIEWLTEFIANMPQEQLKPPRLLTGKDLIDLGYTPGPTFSEILDAIEDAQLEGRLRTPNEARALVKSQWPNP